MFRLLLLCVRSPGTSFPTTTLASQFVSHFAKCPCRWEDEARWAECYIHRRCREMQTGNRDEEGRSVRGWSRGVTVWRGKVWIGRVEVQGIHTYVFCFVFPLIYSTYTSTEAGFFLRGRCSSCTVAHVLCLSPTLWMDGGQSQMFPLERQHHEERQKRHPDRQEREIEQEKAADFTVFRGC